MRAHVLIADSDPGQLQELERSLRTAGHGVVACRSPADLLSRARNEMPAACLLEAGLPGIDPVLAKLLEISARPRIVLLGEPHVPPPRTVRVLGRPFAAARLGELLAEALEERSRELELLDFRAGRADDFEDLLVGGSAAAQRLRLALDRVAVTDTPLLLVGEPGTRKRDIAELVHRNSPRSALPFGAAACDEAEARLEARLFGLPEPEAGAPSTGLDMPRGPGLLDRAAGGTLFLGDVADLTPRLQRRLLEVLENRVWEPPGGSPRTLEVRLVAGTAHDLEDAVARGRLSSDLLYHLNVLTLRVPPLRERLADLAEFSRVYLTRRLPARLLRSVLASAQVEALPKHPWPGNVAELQVVLERIVLAARGAALAEGVTEDAFGGRRSLREVEETLIRRVLEEEGGNRSSAARVLGINRTTLYNKLRAYGLEAPRTESTEPGRFLRDPK